MNRNELFYTLFHSAFYVLAVFVILAVFLSAFPFVFVLIILAFILGGLGILFRNIRTELGGAKTEKTSKKHFDEFGSRKTKATVIDMQESEKVNKGINEP
jgi:type III secretory pathway component EscV